MELSQWFDQQLRATLDGFLWAIEQVPPDRLRVIPPGDLGEWTATQHIFHLMHYEQNLALPSMQQWLGAPPPPRCEVNLEIWEQPPSVEEMMKNYRAARLAQIELLPRFAHVDWQTTRPTTFWGEVSLYWVVAKTYQHCIDHTQELMRLALFWDRVLRRMSQARPASQRGAPSG
jgi:hypothetical protein